MLLATHKATAGISANIKFGGLVFNGENWLAKPGMQRAEPMELITGW